MGLDDGFLQAIAADPADEVTRLVYADWLEDRGDPRGEFIRIEIALDRSSPGDDRSNALVRGRGNCDDRSIRHGRQPWATLSVTARSFSKLPPYLRARWDLLEEFIEIWHPPPTSNVNNSEEDLLAAESQLGFRLSAALHKWNVLIGRRPDVWWQTPYRLNYPPVEKGIGHLVLGGPKQGDNLWVIRAADLRQDDPPIVEIPSGVVFAPSISAFACLVLVYTTLWTSGLASGVIQAARDEVPNRDNRVIALRGLTPCDLPTRYWGIFQHYQIKPIRVFEGNDLLVMYDNVSGVRVAARSQSAYERLGAGLRDLLEVRR